MCDPHSTKPSHLAAILILFIQLHFKLFLRRFLCHLKDFFMENMHE